jgi:hypothetical protein
MAARVSHRNNVKAVEVELAAVQPAFQRVFDADKARAEEGDRMAQPADNSLGAELMKMGSWRRQRAAAVRRFHPASRSATGGANTC